MAEHAHEQLQILGGTHSEALAIAVAEELGTVADVEVSTYFPNGEVYPRLKESVRGDDVYVVQSHANHEDKNDLKSPNDAIMEHALMIKAAYLSSARRVTAVAPHMGYGRQDRRTGRDPVSAQVVFGMLRDAGAKGVITVDQHSQQSEGFFRGPVDSLTARPVFVDYLRGHFGDEPFAVVSPDLGRAKVAEHYVEILGLSPEDDLAIVNKRRETSGNDVTTQHLIGANVVGRTCVIVDDMIDGAGTMCAAAQTLRDHGAERIIAMATHGLFSDPAAERLANSEINSIVVTDSVELPKSIEVIRDRIQVVSVAGLIANAIRAIHDGGSVSALFNGMGRQRL
jgi:ribose-phosphate pyrophosphokinase